MKMRRIQLSMLLLIFMVFTISCQTGNSSQYQELSQRVEKLEKMLGPMSKTLELEASARQERYHQRYIQRSQADKSIYSQDQLDDAEKMYQKANGKGWRTNEAKVSLEKMIEKYPLCNRAGCGTLYLAQWATGVEKEKLLLKAIQKYNDSYYGDGVQVACQKGPLP